MLSLSKTIVKPSFFLWTLSPGHPGHPGHLCKTYACSFDPKQNHRKTNAFSLDTKQNHCNTNAFSWDPISKTIVKP